MTAAPSGPRTWLHALAQPGAALRHNAVSWSRLKFGPLLVTEVVDAAPYFPGPPNNGRFNAALRGVASD